MNPTLLYTLAILSGLGIISAVILYFTARKFYVYEDPRIDDVEKMLPGANCGGCGYPGCRGLADAAVKAETLKGINCPVGGESVMTKIAVFLGKAPTVQEPMVAVLHCSGDCTHRPRTNRYDGAPRCSVAAALYGGETGCSYGCLGFGDCADACRFGALRIDPETGLPEVDETKCTACGACVTACPKGLFKLRRKGVKGRRIFVACSNRDKGATARKACSVACIGCGKCVKSCPFEAIRLEHNLARIDPVNCKLCRKCVGECPTSAIHAVNFPAPKTEKREEATC